MTPVSPSAAATDVGQTHGLLTQLPLDLPVATEEEAAAAGQGWLVAAAAPPLIIQVLGKPITQGSKVKGRYGNIRDDNAATLHPWRVQVTAAAVDALGDRARITTACEVSLWFYFERPASHYGTGRNAEQLKPNAPAYPDNVKSGDIDKLQRAVFDALTAAGVWKDDSLVARVYAEKLWTGGSGMPIPGARIHVSELHR